MFFFVPPCTSMQSCSSASWCMCCQFVPVHILICIMPNADCYQWPASAGTKHCRWDHHQSLPPDNPPWPTVPQPPGMPREQYGRNTGARASTAQLCSAVLGIAIPNPANALPWTVNHTTACCQHNHTAHAAAIFCRLSNQARAINNARDLIANPANWIWAQKYQQKYGGKRSALLCATAIYHSHHNANLDALTPVAYTTRTKHAYTPPPLTKTRSPSAHACTGHQTSGT
jgi:hypothetical protein